MSKNNELLKSYADDFSELLGVECKVISGGSKDLFAIAECLEYGALNPITAFDSSKSLIKICEAYFAGVRFQQKKTAKVVNDLDEEVYVPPQPVTWKYESKQSKVAVGLWDLPQYVGPVAIGAVCQVRFLDEKLPRGERYISFGQYNEETEIDEYGVSDSDIFFYAHEGEAQVKKFMVEEEVFEEFVVLSYYLKYQEASPENQLHYEMEITDQRETCGQLNVDVSAIGGNFDDMLSATFEINKLPGTESATQCMHLYFDGENVAVSFFKQGDKYIIRPEINVTITPVVLETGYMGYVLE